MNLSKKIEPGSTVCPYCSREFNSLQSVNLHIAKSHSGREQVPGQTVCELCAGRTFSRHSAYNHTHAHPSTASVKSRRA